MKTLNKKLIIAVLVNMIISVSANALTDVLKVKLSNPTYWDEAIIRFLPDATNGFDGNYDAMKFLSSNPSVPSVYTDIDSVTHLSINALPSFVHIANVELHIKINCSGNYTFQAYEPGSFLPGVSIVMEDKITGIRYNFRDGNFFTIYLTANTVSNSNRFVIHFSYPTNITTTNVSCDGLADGAVTLTKAENNDWNYELIKSGCATVNTGNHIAETITINGLEQGMYNLMTTSPTTSPEYSQIIIFKTEVIVADFISSTNEATLSNATIQFTNHSINSTSWLWDFGDNSPLSYEESPTHQYMEAETFTVSLIAGSNNCSANISQTIIVNPDSTTGIGINNQGENSLLLFQENDLVVINLKSNMPSDNSINIYNLLGQNVYSFSDKNTNELIVKTSLSTSGIYLIHAQINHNSISKQIAYYKNN